MAVAANAVWTNERLRRAKFVESPLCCRCKDIFHRVWQCKHPDAVSARPVFATRALGF